MSRKHKIKAGSVGGPIQQITSWSYSRYAAYTQCPLKAKLKFIDKIPEPGSEAMNRGSEVHDKADKYIKGDIKRLPEDLKKFEKLFKDLKADRKKDAPIVATEKDWAFTKTWTPTQWNDWANCWVRIKIDCTQLFVDDGHMVIFDWKTGKDRPEKVEEYKEQISLYELGAFMLYPALQTVESYLVFLDTGAVYPSEDCNDEEVITTRSQVDKLRLMWEKNTKPMLSDKAFPARPNRFCSWCFYRKSNKANGGGQCEF